MTDDTDKRTPSPRGPSGDPGSGPPGDAPRKDAEREGDSKPLYVGRYHLDSILGRGGTCTVFQAWDTRLQRHVAIKRLEDSLLEDPHARARFNREGRAIARLSHPHLVTLIDRGSTDDEEYLVFEYIEGRSLKELQRENGPLEPKDACHIAGQVAEGLASAHLAGIVHRDVKPQNILLDAEGRAKLTDFGIATGADLTRVTRAGAIVGSGRYMAPEQVQSRPVDARSDLYSLGIVLYEMLAGEPPFSGQSIAEIGRQHVREQAQPLDEVRPGLPPGLSRVVMRCLEKLPENRFQSMEELLGALVGLDLYSLERTSGGLVENLRRVGMGSRDRADTGDWRPPPGAKAPPPPADLPALTPIPGPSRVERRRSRDARRKTGPRLGLLAALLIGVAVVAGLVWALLGGNPEAPDVVGLPLDQAREAASGAGVDIEVSEDQVPSFEDGTRVVEQSPTAGEPAEDGTLRVRVTRQAESVAIESVSALDPEGDQSEHPDELPALYDDDPDSAWTSEGYATPSFGSTGKSGIGLEFQLAGEAQLVRVRAQAAGWQGQLQIPSAGGWEPVEELTGEDEQAVTLDEPVSGLRLWITSLPEQAGSDNYHRAVVNEVSFYN